MGTTPPGQSWPGRIGNEGVFHVFQNSRTGASPPDVVLCLFFWRALPYHRGCCWHSLRPTENVWDILWIIYQFFKCYIVLKIEHVICLLSPIPNHGPKVINHHDLLLILLCKKDRHECLLIIFISFLFRLYSCSEDVNFSSCCLKGGKLCPPLIITPSWICISLSKFTLIKLQGSVFTILTVSIFSSLPSLLFVLYSPMALFTLPNLCRCDLFLALL